MNPSDSHDLLGHQGIKGRIVVYSIGGCPHCLEAKNTLSELKLPFTDVSVDRFPANVRDWLKERTGKSSVPQIFFNNNHIGGNDAFQKLVKDQEEFNHVLRDMHQNGPPEGPDAPLLPHPGEAIDIPSIDGEAVHCEMDEFIYLIEEMKKAGIVKTHKKAFPFCFVKVKDSFTGKDFVDWIEDKKLISRERAVFMGRQLVSKKFGVNVDEREDFCDASGALYKLSTSDASRALNAGEMSQCVQRPAGEVAEHLRKLILQLFGDYLSKDGKTVDYKGIATSKSFEAYKRMTLELQRVELEMISHEERLAFFINIYNALVIHGNVEKGTPSNMWQRYRFFSTIAYNLGGHVYSLNDIENGILRANRGSMGTLYITPFGKEDPRLKLALEKPEPRIHFALNCGARSCPPIKTFSSDEIDKQLDVATESYLENDDAVRVNVEESTVYLSMLFKWYHKDFGKDKDEILKWIYDRITTDDDKKKQLGEVIQSTECKVDYIPYDWGNNRKED
ncbi:uncharacterized protein LOC131893495 isoform X1 [Tigriopus californicus]|uniref:uncharacterized protein LOC131893495 isoform X1 n=1 Tax=Tigriopus californicus TaxID=6832 RepID=UPI0027DA6ED2|nr:uncharacterized protein LOC131893495 isoform X1 [Tigriopus californicus]XP_059099525.1 uncharacterized protein LOC131893495 isoform X1 [Tigriopus californicus]XP_059099526.1 uncharacterized protein LOC131893495 isoform X1 [Tigriopus californicus]